MKVLKEQLAYTEIQLLPAFHDFDPLRIVWHGNYVKYLEIARCALLRGIHYDYPQMQDSGYIWPVVDMRMKYIRPIVYGRAILISCAVTEWEHRLKINYEIRDGESLALLHRAYTIQVALDAETNEMCYQTPHILAECLNVIVG